MISDERKLVLAIDFNNMVFSSFYGQELINSQGINVNAVKSFFVKIKILREIFNPDYIVVASDLSRERTFRRRLCPTYKAQRKKTDPGIGIQMKIAGQIVALLGFPTLNNELYEADDILGMISRFDESLGMDTVIASSDRDLYQLVSDHTFIMNPRGNDLVDREYIRDNYGLTPEQWIDLKTLQGDPSDNIPGIPGIGQKTALELMHRYGSLDNIYANLNDIPLKIRSRLIVGEPSIPITRELVTIVTDYSLIDMCIEKLYRTEVCEEEVMGVIQDLEIYSLLDVMRYHLLPQPNDRIQVYDRKEVLNATRKSNNSSNGIVRSESQSIPSGAVILSSY